MTEKKNAPASAVTLTGAVETGTPAKTASTSTCDSTTPTEKCQTIEAAS